MADVDESLDDGYSKEPASQTGSQRCIRECTVNEIRPQSPKIKKNENNEYETVSGALPSTSKVGNVHSRREFILPACGRLIQTKDLVAQPPISEVTEVRHQLMFRAATSAQGVNHMQYVRSLRVVRVAQSLLLSLG